MNIYATIILSAVLLGYFLDILADSFNLKALQTELPGEFHGVYDENAYRQSQEYTRVNTRFGFLTSTLDLLVMLIFWFAGGFQALDHVVRGWGLHPILNGLCYMGILVFFKTLLSIPFSIYDTFVIEERFGFNKTTAKTFLTDFLKGIGLSLLIGGPLLAGLLAFFQYAGSSAWLYCWGVTTLVTLFLQLIAPTWIMPLFNKFTPLEEGELRDKILSYAQSVKFPLENLFVMDGSKRSTKSNAFFTGFGKHKRIALFDTLIEKQSVPELVAVLAHEIGHYKKKHVLQNLIIGILHAGAMFYLLSVFISHRGLFDAFYMQRQSIYAGFIFFGMLYTPIELMLSVLLQMFSRKNEYEADRFAVETTNTPEAFVNALKKLSVHNLSNLTPHPFYVFLNYSHPPVLQRIHAIMQVKSND